MKLVIKRSHAQFINRTHHPWIYRQALTEDVKDEDAHGNICRIYDEGGRFIGYGFYSVFSKIACRIISFDEKGPDKDWISKRIQSALSLRKQLIINSNAFRILNAEGDNFPGLILDIYNRTLVLRPEIRGIEYLIPDIIKILKENFPHCSIFLKRDEKAARIEKLIYKTGYLVGSGDGSEIIEENGLRFFVDLYQGQKTGFYLDQRDNRMMVKEISSKKRVLDLFSYTGGFTINAVSGGASSVDAVESSSYAIKLAQENYKFNFEDKTDKVKWSKGDTFKFLEDVKDKYDLIIMDPPPFARSKGELKGALRGYRWLHERVFSILNAGGFLFTFSCSHAVTRALFLDVILRSARDSGRHIQIVKDLRASPDHPWSIYHRDADYMKGFLLYVH